MTAQRSDTIWTKTFILLCAAQLLGYAQHFMLAPVLPLYVTQLGGSPLVVGVVLSCFAVTSVIVRPLVGHWVDRWSEAGVMISGMCFQAVSVFFCFIPFIPFTALANALRGIGWGGLNTGGYSLLARIAPESRRGAASGLYSGVQSSAQIFFPPIALWLLYASFGGYRAVFIVTAIFSIAGAVTGLILAPLVARPALGADPRRRDAVVARDLPFHRTGDFAAVDPPLVAQCVFAGDYQFHYSLRERTRHRELRRVLHRHRRHQHARPPAARPSVG